MKAPYLLAALTLALTATACGSDDSSSAGGAATTIGVDSGDTSCTLDAPSAPAGTVRFEVSNSGSQTTEFYLYAEDGTTIVGEVEGVGPGISRDLEAALDAGAYVAACKPGETGDGIRTDFTVE